MRSKFLQDPQFAGSAFAWLFWKGSKIERGVKTQSIRFHGIQRRRQPQKRIGLLFVKQMFAYFVLY